MNAPQNKMHPLMMIAATSVTVASLAAIASFSGWLPGKSAPNQELTAAISLTAPASPAVPSPVIEPPASTPALPAPVTARKTEEQTVTTHKVHKINPEKQARSNPAPHNPTVLPPNQETPPQEARGATSQPATPPVCRECGTVESVREIRSNAQGSGLGVLAGGVIGGLLGNQVGKGNGRAAATVAAAVGGAYAGHEVEKNMRGDKQFEVTVRFDDDNTRTFIQPEGNRWYPGERVRSSNGSLLPM